MTETPGGARWQNKDKQMSERGGLVTAPDVLVTPLPEQRPKQAPTTGSDTNKRGTSYPQSS